MPPSPSAFSLPAGAHDYGAVETRQRAFIERTLLQVFRQHGYDEVTVPTLEYAELYHPDRIGSDLFYHLVMARLSEGAEFPASTQPREPSFTHDVVLRPDLTAPVARSFITRLLDEGRPPYLPVRMAYAGQVFRNIKPRDLRQKEFRQVGVELVGSQSRQADLEVLGLLPLCAQALGLPRFEVRLGHAGLYKAFIGALVTHHNDLIASQLEQLARLRLFSDSSGDEARLREYLAGHGASLRDRLQRETDVGLQAALAPLPAWLPTVADLPEEALRREPLAFFERYLQALWQRRLGLPPATCDELLALSRLSPEPAAFFAGVARHAEHNEPARRWVEELRWLCEHLEAGEGLGPGGRLLLTPAASRGLAYYTGITFELHSPDVTSPYTDLCGGGRYDRLYPWIYERAVATYKLRRGEGPSPLADTGALFSAVGLAFGVEHVAAALPAAPPAPGPIFIAVQDAALALPAARFAAQLRRRGLAVACHLPQSDATPRAGELREQLGRASHLGAPATAIFFEREWQEGKIKVKDMQTEQQEDLSLPEAERWLVERAAGGRP